MLNETDLFFYKGRTELPLLFLFRIVSFINETFVDAVDDNSGSC